MKLGTKRLLIFTRYMLWGFFFNGRKVTKEDRRRDGLST
jgi:hypothetical protein